MSTVHNSEISDRLERTVQNTLGVFNQPVVVKAGVSAVANHLCVNLFA